MPAWSREAFLRGASITCQIRWGLQSRSPKHGRSPSPDSKHGKGHPCSGPASSSKAAALSTGKRFEPNQNKTSKPRNVPVRGFVKVWCLSRSRLEEEVTGRGCCGTKQLRVFGWQTGPWGSPRAKLLCQERCRELGTGEHPPPTPQPPRPQERGGSGTAEPPREALKGFQMCPPLAEMLGVGGGGNPSDPWQGNKHCSDNKSNQVGCTGAATGQSSLPTATGTPEQSPALPPSAHPTWHRTGLGAAHGAPAPSGNRDHPCSHKTGPIPPGRRDPQSTKGDVTGTRGTEGGWPGPALAPERQSRSF